MKHRQPLHQAIQDFMTEKFAEDACNKFTENKQ